MEQFKNDSGKKIAVLFPGIGYTKDKPILYYAGKIAASAGYDVCRLVSFNYSPGKSIRGNEPEMRKAFLELYKEAENQLAEIDWKEYDDILFLSKSIGTVIGSAYAEKYNLNDKIRHILYTPLEYTFENNPKNAIGFIGTADPWCEYQNVIRAAKEQNIKMYVYDGLNHSLENDDNMHNLSIIKDVMEKTEEFVSGSTY